ncbi:site-specific DNA-methyltransferase [Palleniella muris]|uniref:Site-specific DNA-methyltransferase n=1 Tax=Palleniella muris TaxID=3038145 RepID=A0AC61QTD2_9BACT|nr:DNA methyltransferase [Palleniella muris]TGX83526.1 site-specific DNA-methyltransferase [Palleniella muris]
MKQRAPRNKTITIQLDEKQELKNRLATVGTLRNDRDWTDCVIHGDIMDVLKELPDAFADMIIVDPPYNLSRKFGKQFFSKKTEEDYEAYMRSWLPDVCRKLKDDGSLYLCGDWHCTSILQRVLAENLHIINRITWQRDKGRGATANWKNSMEDIWFAVKNPDNYHFNLDAVKMRRIVKAPYKTDGKPKDWHQSRDGKFRDTCPGNFWDDISIPFWSMPENTEHPTQKPEKLYAKLILASSMEGDTIFDPFLGSGTSAVVAKKLGRHFVGCEIEEEYCLVAQKRLNIAEDNRTIQGYKDGVFWERNSQPYQ